MDLSHVINHHSLSPSSSSSTRSCSLFKQIDISKVWALNESLEGSSKKVLRSWDLRLEDSSGYLESNEGDPELLIYIPFTTDVKIKSIMVIGGGEGRSPSKMRAFINREDLDFALVGAMVPLQEWDLIENCNGDVEYETRYPKFQGVSNITLHFPMSFGGDSTRISFIGFQGEATQIKRDVVTNAVYETVPNPAEHKLPSGTPPPPTVL